MSRFLRILKTSIGRKLLMAVSGLFTLGFVVGHLAGNLKMLAGPEEMNSYAEFLHQHPSLTWPVRIGLIVFLTGHVVTGVLLWGKNRAARPKGYARNRTLRASLASRLRELVAQPHDASLVIERLTTLRREVEKRRLERLGREGAVNPHANQPRGGSRQIRRRSRRTRRRRGRSWGR